MTNEETLAIIRTFVEAQVRHSVTDTEDAWRHVVKDLLPLYLQFQILDKLQNIDDTLVTILNPSGKDTP